MERKKVVVGLSGGVDSSVAAYLLKEQGYEVIGLFMRNWDSTLSNDVKGNTEFNNEVCPQELDYIDAKKVAEKLDIQLHRVDFIKEYWDYVFEYFLSEYKKGRTPNPDILCNKYIKFDKFMEHAITKLGADYIAMGHYAGVKLNTKTNQFELLKAVDENKDQTYFLCQLTHDQLSKTLFPLYEYKKEEIRAIAKAQDLATAVKKDSTGICFIGERQFTKFLENYIPNQPGDIVDIKTNKVLGKHIGVMYYTIGQRKGLNLGGMSEPYYVADKDIDKKIIYVSSSSDESYLQSTSCIVKDINWIVDLEKYFKNSSEFKCMAKFRYRQKDNGVTVIKLDESNYKIIFDEMSKAVTIGQEAVFYLGDVCLGGGIIDKVDK